MSAEMGFGFVFSKEGEGHGKGAFVPSGWIPEDGKKGS